MPVSAKTYFLNSDKSKVVAEDSSDAHFLLAREGCEVPAEDVEKYGLKTMPEPSKRDENVVNEADAAAVEESEESTELKGKLPEDFPGHAALEAAGITTYAQLRKAGDVTEVPGIGKATAEKIADALG